MAGKREVVAAEGEKRMSKFDSLIAEINGRFNLNDKAEMLLTALIDLMTNENHGRLTGFLEKFNQIGLSDATASWVGTGANLDVTVGQIESALGTDALHAITNQTAADYDTSMAALAYAIPRLADALTADGGVQSPRGDSMTEADDLKTAESVPAVETFDRIGTAARIELKENKTESRESNAFNERTNETLDKVDASAGKVEANANKTNRNSPSGNNSPLAWILPLVLLGLLLTLGYWFCSKAPPAANEQTVDVNQQ